MIYIYNDEGVSQESLKQTLNTFQKTPYQVETIDAERVINNKWIDDAALLIMPGGADLPYHNKLSGKGNKNIKTYVKEGGAYLGICAGGYYGAAQVIFDKGGPLEVIGSRELSFYDGKAIGPVLAPYDYLSNSGSRAAKVTFNSKVASIYYNGGGYFEYAESKPHTKVIGTYANHLPAIVSIQYQKGSVVLSGVHFEYDASLLDSEDKFLNKIIGELAQSNNKRLLLLNEVLSQLGV